MSFEGRPKRLISAIVDLARSATEELPKESSGLGAVTENVMGRVQEFLDTRLKPMGQDLKREIEDQLFSRIKAELRKQFLYQWLAIVAGIGSALVIAWVR